jgi:hypothetical protein
VSGTRWLRYLADRAYASQRLEADLEAVDGLEVRVDRAARRAHLHIINAGSGVDRQVIGAYAVADIRVLHEHVVDAGSGIDEKLARGRQAVD